MSIIFAQAELNLHIILVKFQNVPKCYLLEKILENNYLCFYLGETLNITDTNRSGGFRNES